MRSLGLILLLVVVALANGQPQHTYDGRNGPHVFGSPGQQVYIRGQNEGPYQVDGVGGTFQNTPQRGEHVFTDEHGNTFVHRKNGGGVPATHSISGPAVTATHGPGLDNRNTYRTVSAGGASATRHSRDTFQVSRPDRTVVFNTGRRRRSPDFVVSRPDRVVVASGGNYEVTRNSRDTFHVERPGRTVDFDTNGAYSAQRQRRSPDFVVSRPDRVVVASGGNYHVSRSKRDVFQVSRPDRGVVFDTDRRRRSPQFISGPDGRYVNQQADTLTAVRPDGRYVQLSRSRRDISDARVQGENFVARDDQAGVWNDNFSVWRRPDGRTVTLDSNGNAITSGRGRAPQHYSG
ncbi:uncharacterized protein Dwil_GK10648 [Drosophila willistoni]|uniref:Immune-induced peptides n=1 Tax=Drosophila willistoni TaxID=7260 RepID=B4MIW2_DROWI|nr:immune-induced peptides [Drosophila willistoni]EDW72051.1 uncharacterized protein Dwil_GK10648 [Drosophila willistoni]